MARNRIFTDTDIEGIIEVIRAWPTGTIAWANVCKKAESVLGFIPSRQGLSQHQAIQTAFQARKEGLRIAPQKDRPMPSSLAVASERIARLNAQIAELELENTRLRDRFITWQYNAHARNMTQADLDTPLPQIDREVDSSEKDEYGRVI
ncbi:MAG: hypothetical protein PHV02_05010 [Rhodocyclaceae bacterium]|nr:hypothetical protein [Rhodocyclaceae bacterium]